MNVENKAVTFHLLISFTYALITCKMLLNELNQKTDSKCVQKQVFIIYKTKNMAKKVPDKINMWKRNF